MKSAVLFAFVFLTVLYLTPIATNDRFWGGLNLITQYGLISFLCWVIEKGIKTLSDIERLFFQYVKWLSAANCLYIIACIIKGRSWSIYNTDIFAYIIGIGFITFLIHCATMGSERDQT